MARPNRTRAYAAPQHKFRDKLLLNQWLISLFGVDPLAEYLINNKPARPFHKLAASLKDSRQEGLDERNIHRFYDLLINDLRHTTDAKLSADQLLTYEQNIVTHTQAINEGRQQPITWKYHQWLTLLFTEIYLDRYFGDKAALVEELNAYVARFNRHYADFADVPDFGVDDLNKLCFQNATGSGKTLLMHVHLRQYQHYAKRAGMGDDLSRIILLTPNESLSAQHIREFRASGIQAQHYLESRGQLFGQAGLGHVDVLEITKVADQEGPNTIAVRSLGDKNLLLVDEGHRGMSGKEEGAWFSRRAALCEKGFTFEYSATFEQAVASSGNSDMENSYAKSILFDYSYRYFYEDGFGKDYQIFNLPATYDAVEKLYLTACLLKFYQQLRIYADKRAAFIPFNLEKPLWVFVGSSVQGSITTNEEKVAASDVARVLQFIADFLADGAAAQQRIGEILGGAGQQTGLLDSDGNDIFAGGFTYLQEKRNAGEGIAQIYRDILTRLFNHAGGGQLELQRVKGSGEIILRCGLADEPFGLINVGDAKGLVDHVTEVAAQQRTPLSVTDDEFAQPIFAKLSEISSPITLLIGSKKFIEGWDNWRVSTLGLMHVGRSEGTQIIQLFGRGVRLKGWNWSLKRSGYSHAPARPTFIEEIETLNVFGIQADFMERFRDFLREEGLPGNERKRVFTLPLNVTYDFGKRLLILRPKKNAANGQEYDFKRDAPVPAVGDIPEYLTHNRVVTDWYTRIDAVKSRKRENVAQKDEDWFTEQHLAFLDFDALYFELEQYKRERTWHNLNIDKVAIRRLLRERAWYQIVIPKDRLAPTSYENVRLWQQIAGELLKRYIDHLYNYCKRAFLEPRLELRELSQADGLLPDEREYEVVVDDNDAGIIGQVERLLDELQANREGLFPAGQLNAAVFPTHLYQPLFHVQRGGRIQVMPVALNESEYQFVSDLYGYCQREKQMLEGAGIELYLLRNRGRGQGIGFFEAGNFHPDFMLWLLHGDKQFLTFIEPHGLIHEGPGRAKVQFYQRVKEVEARLRNPNVTLDSFILSWSARSELQWGWTAEQFLENHVLFMREERQTYVNSLIEQLLGATTPSSV